MHHLITFGRCLADPHVIRILVILLACDLGTRELMQLLGLRRSTMDLRLRMLRECGLIETARVGRTLKFRVSAGQRPMIESIFHRFRDEITWDPYLTAYRDRVFSDADSEDSDFPEHSEP